MPVYTSSYDELPSVSIPILPVSCDLEGGTRGARESFGEPEPELEVVLVAFPRGRLNSISWRGIPSHRGHGRRVPIAMAAMLAR